MTNTTHRFFSLALVSMLAACGGGGDGLPDDNDGDVPPTGCIMKLEGEVSGNFTCIATGGKSAEDSSSVIGAVTTGISGEVDTITFALEVDGELARRSYAAGDIITGGVVVVLDGGNGYLAAVGTENNMGSVGSVTITGLEEVAREDGTVVWEIHGSFSATLVNPQTHKQVRLTATF